MPTMSSGSPMEIGTTGPTYASMAASQKSPALSPSTCSAAVAPAATNANININTTATVTAASASTSTAAGATNAAPPTKQSNRYPPLVVETLPDWPTHFRELKKLLYASVHVASARCDAQNIMYRVSLDVSYVGRNIHTQTQKNHPDTIRELV
ncbi:unnamed protein product [Colias eurytheme]|nr:unnamed protein product [Colias eurytheme]